MKTREGGGNEKGIAGGKGREEEGGINSVLEDVLEFLLR